MPDLSTLAVFAAASLALIAVPGPSVLYIVGTSISQGRRAGVASMLGVQAGALIHVAAAAIGVSALLASSAGLFNVVKFAGAAYLVWLGVQRIRHAGEQDPAARPPRSHAHLFRQGVVVNLLNPKVAMFFLAFLPQFVDPDAASPGAQVLALGLVFVAIAIVSDGFYALVAGAAAERLRGSVRARRRMDRLGGGVMIGLGAVAALTGHRRS
jgi:threonine/homoserine/homoserine lactone efflux protein